MRAAIAEYVEREEVYERESMRIEKGGNATRQAAMLFLAKLLINGLLRGEVKARCHVPGNLVA